MSKVVYASCDYDGVFQELVLLSKDQIISEVDLSTLEQGYEDYEEGEIILVTYLDDKGEEDEFMYCDKVEI